MGGPLADPLAELAGLEGVPSAVMSARDAVDAVLRDRGRRIVRPEQSAAALVAAARASAALEEVADPERWQAAAVRLYTELVGLAPLIRVSPGQAVARAHTVLARGMVPDEELGRVRGGGGRGDRLTALNRLLTAATLAPAIVVAGIAHAELLATAPFSAGNGIVARAVEHMVLIDGDVDRPAVTVPEAGHQTLGEAYRRAFDEYQTGTAAGVRAWLLHVAAAVAKGAELAPLDPVRRYPGQ
jgi:hypothetical protein